jgi:hypothetical protein
VLTPLTNTLTATRIMAVHRHQCQIDILICNSKIVNCTENTWSRVEASCTTTILQALVGSKWDSPPLVVSYFGGTQLAVFFMRRPMLFLTCCIAILDLHARLTRLESDVTLLLLATFGTAGDVYHSILFPPTPLTIVPARAK